MAPSKQTKVSKDSKGKSNPSRQTRSGAETKKREQLFKLHQLAEEEADKRKNGNPTGDFEETLQKYTPHVGVSAVQKVREFLDGKSNLPEVDDVQMEDAQHTDSAITEDPAPVPGQQGPATAPAKQVTGSSADKSQVRGPEDDVKDPSLTTSIDVDNEACVGISAEHDNPNASVGQSNDTHAVVWVRPILRDDVVWGRQAITWEDKLDFEQDGKPKEIHLYTLNALSNVIKSKVERDEYIRNLEDRHDFRKVIGRLDELPNAVSHCRCSQVIRRPNWTLPHDDGGNEVLGGKEQMWIFVKYDSGSGKEVKKWFSIGTLAAKYGAKSTMILRRKVLGLDGDYSRIATLSPAPVASRAASPKTRAVTSTERQDDQGAEPPFGKRVEDMTDEDIKVYVDKLMKALNNRTPSPPSEARAGQNYLTPSPMPRPVLV